MHPGDVVAGRFEIEGEAGAGSMGAVYRARDRVAGGSVAIKVMRTTDEELSRRFEREALVLARLEHRGIVKYVAHGATEDGRPYLAMQWLEGETLAARLGRDPLGVADVVEVGARIADALSAVHRRGIVHRDIKPSNIVLCGGQVERATLLDFGVARAGSLAGALDTAAGRLIGTPSYMSPEQARGAREVDARSDVFALGCVLFRCLTGETAFRADDPVAVLARIVLEEPPRVHELAPHVPPALDALVARMMAKDPEERHRDGAALAAAIAELDRSALGDSKPPRAPSMPPALSGAEHAAVSVVAVGAGKRSSTEDEPTRVRGAGEDARVERIREVVAQSGGRLELLASGTAIVVLRAGGSAKDQTARAARCALSIGHSLPDVPVALATGRGIAAGGHTTGEALDRAIGLLSDRRPRPAGVRADAVSAALLEARFDVARDGESIALLGERERDEPTRTLLGRPTPYVGRDSELARLDAIARESFDDSTARVVLVTAPAGMGKSRLRQEFTRTLEKSRPRVQVWIGRGDPMSAGSPFGMIGPALRRAAGVLHGEPSLQTRRKLAALVEGVVAEADAERVIEFLGEIVGARFPDDSSPRLRAARRDAAAMGSETRRAWEDLLEGLCASGPLLLVLEDLHWGDLPSVSFVDAALRHLREKPFMVMALARPEVHEQFPRLWAGREVEELRLHGLPRRGSEGLVRAMLGDTPDEATVARMVDRAAGNAFFLEEIIRAVAEGKADELPATVVAVMHARMEALEPEVRRVLRAASVFGQDFSRDGVRALLGERSVADLDARLESLVVRELIVVRRDGRSSSESDYRFRHAIVREAAYAMLTDEDRALGHKLAGEWLERAGEHDAMVLAEHFERGGDTGRALGLYLRAAEQALLAHDFAAAVARAERGVACGASGDVLGDLRLAQAVAHKHQGELALALQRAEQAVALHRPGSTRWNASVATWIGSADLLGEEEAWERVARMLHDVRCDEDASAQREMAIAHEQLAIARLFAGRFTEACATADEMDKLAEALSGTDAVLDARRLRLRAMIALRDDDLETALSHAEAAVRSAEASGELNWVCGARHSLGNLHLELGLFAEGEEIFRELLAQSERFPARHAMSRSHLALTMSLRGVLREAEAHAREAVEAFCAIGSPRNEAGTRVYLARVLLAAGKLDEAAEEARIASELCASERPMLVIALTARASIDVARERFREALAWAEQALSLADSLAHFEEGEALLRLAYAQALDALGETQRAREAIRSARDRLLARASRIKDVRLRESFLRSVPENARILELEREWS